MFNRGGKIGGGGGCLFKCAARMFCGGLPTCSCMAARDSRGLGDGASWWAAGGVEEDEGGFALIAGLFSRRRSDKWLFWGVRGGVGGPPCPDDDEVGVEGT